MIWPYSDPWGYTRRYFKSSLVATLRARTVRSSRARMAPRWLRYSARMMRGFAALFFSRLDANT